MKNTLLFLLLIPFILQAQAPLTAFDNLVGSTWEVKGKWGNGEEFRQEYAFQWSLNKKMVKVQTKGTVDMLTKEYGLRNEGIRFWRENENKIVFYEFDVFGGITEGICNIEGKNIYYEYEYDGLTLRDSWIYQDENTYELVVASLENGKQKDVYQKSTVKRQD